MLCAQDAHEALVAFTMRLLQTTRERRVQDISAAVAEDSELTSHITDVFGWPRFFDLSLDTLEPQPLRKGKTTSSRTTTTRVPADEHLAQTAPETPPGKTRRPPTAAEETPLKRPRFRTAGEAAAKPRVEAAKKTPATSEATTPETATSAATSTNLESAGASWQWPAPC